MNGSVFYEIPMKPARGFVRFLARPYAKPYLIEGTPLNQRIILPGLIYEAE